MIITSNSKQFIVRGRPQGGASPMLKSDQVYADPALLAVVCDRVREALRRELNWGADKWRSSIFINIHPAGAGGTAATVRVMRFGGDWRYRIEMPEETTRHEMVAPVVEALLLEFANRGGAKECVELPPWLAEGLTSHLLTGPLSGLALHVERLDVRQPNTLVPLPVRSYSNRVRTNNTESGFLRAQLQARGAMTVDQLNWAHFDPGDPESARDYRLSSHLFVRELLRMRAGPDCLSTTLALLPGHLNWQTSFLRGFEAHFQTMLDAEKWWSLVVAHTKAGETSARWNPAESHARFEDILYTPMQVQLTPADLPHITPVELQTVLGDWALADQEPLLRGKIAQLQLLRLRVPPEFVPVADGYRTALEKYLAARVKLAGKNPAARKVRNLVKDAVAELNAIDGRRNQIHARLLAAEAERPALEKGGSEREF